MEGGAEAGRGVEAEVGRGGQAGEAGVGAGPQRIQRAIDFTLQV